MFVLFLPGCINNNIQYIFSKASLTGSCISAVRSTILRRFNFYPLFIKYFLNVLMGAQFMVVIRSSFIMFALIL